MKPFIFILTILLGVGAGITALRFFQTPTVGNPATLSASSTTVSVTVQPTPAIEVARPIQILIPKLNVDATVENVGKDARGNMDVPSDFNNVGWYELGVKPGETGNAVLAGHLDTPTGSEAVFYGLSTLVPGDAIIIVDANDSKRTFVVMDTNTYPTDSFPIQKVFGENKTAALQLITCEGNFDNTRKSYSDRLVISARLQDI